MYLSLQQIIILIITIIAICDFLLFTILFLMYLFNITIRAKKINLKIGSVFISIFFIGFKLLYVPIFMSTLQFISYKSNDIVNYIIIIVNISLTIIPLVTTLFTFLRHYFIKVEDHLYKNEKVNIIIPIYNEKPESLWNTIESIKNLDYNREKIHVYLAFDDDKTPEAFIYLLDKYKISIESVLNNYCIDIDDIINISVCRFPHGGKKSAQQGAYNIIKSRNNIEELDKTYLFYIDSDIILKRDCLWQFLHHMKRFNKSCLTGMINCMTSENIKLITLYQDIEYTSGQIFWRNMENMFSATSCLPGAFTIIKFTMFNNVADKYFSKKEYNNMFEYQRFYLGEDRYLTHLLMINEPHKIGFCEAARCKTEAPDKIAGLLKQRRRWFLGHMSNDTCMLSSMNIWKMYPLFTLFNFLNNARNISIYIYIVYFSLLLNYKTSVLFWFLYIIMPTVLKWIFLTYYSIHIRRRMNIISYLIIVTLQPIFNTILMYYTLFTMNTRTWGGIRVEKEDQNENENGQQNV